MFIFSPAASVVFLKEKWLSQQICLAETRVFLGTSKQAQEML